MLVAAAATAAARAAPAAAAASAAWARPPAPPPGRGAPASAPPERQAVRLPGQQFCGSSVRGEGRKRRPPPDQPAAPSCQSRPASHLQCACIAVYSRCTTQICRSRLSRSTPARPTQVAMAGAGVVQTAASAAGCNVRSECARNVRLRDGEEAIWANPAGGTLRRGGGAPCICVAANCLLKLDLNHSDSTARLCEQPPWASRHQHRVQQRIHGEHPRDPAKRPVIRQA
jgi:hypothetical protein